MDGWTFRVEHLRDPHGRHPRDRLDGRRQGVDRAGSSSGGLGDVATLKKPVDLLTCWPPSEPYLL